MKLNTYVNFAGTCAEAFRYYERHLGGQVTMLMTHDQAPGQRQVSPDWKDPGTARADHDWRHGPSGRRHSGCRAATQRVSDAQR